MHAPPALFDLCPDLALALPRVDLCRRPTPVEPAKRLAESAGMASLWVKRDEDSARPYGGNKPRKLEFLLGRALASGRRRVLTTGGLGTNHGFATALYARRFGLACELVLIDQPLDARVRRKLLQIAATGAELFHARDVPGAARVVLTRLARHPRTLYVPSGGSNVTGAIGFVDAGLELAAQVRAGALPEPARAYVALGTGGSAAGLALGFALGGLTTRVVGVLVTDLLPPRPGPLARLARRALRRLRRAGAPLPRTVPLALEVERRFVGGGYGHATEPGLAALRAAEDREGWGLEPVYTGKTLAALLERERNAGEPVLFWNTYALSEPELPLPEPSELPPAFHRFFEASR